MLVLHAGREDACVDGVLQGISIQRFGKPVVSHTLGPITSIFTAWVRGGVVHCLGSSGSGDLFFS